MRTFRLYIFAISLPMTILFMAGCKKDRKYQDATIVYAGDPATDGCGWLIRIGATEFKPANLTQEYQIDQLEVRIKYYLFDTKANCGWVQNKFRVLRLEDIKRK